MSAVQTKWPETAPELSVNTASDWLAIGMRNLAESECRSPVSNRQAFTIPEASAKSNANSIMNAVSRLVRLWEKILILAVACSSSRIRTCEGPTFDLDQREVGAQRSSESIRRPCLEDASAPRPLSVRCRTRQRACRGSQRHRLGLSPIKLSTGASPWGVKWIDSLEWKPSSRIG